MKFISKTVSIKISIIELMEKDGRPSNVIIDEAINLVDKELHGNMMLSKSCMKMGKNLKFSVEAFNFFQKNRAIKESFSEVVSGYLETYFLEMYRRGKEKNEETGNSGTMD